MSIIYVKNSRSGSTYAYESTAKWDPQKKQSRPVRKYLGRVDPVTGEIVPTTGRKGRISREEDTISEPNAVNTDYKALYLECLEARKNCEAKLKELESQNVLLRRELSVARKEITRIHTITLGFLSGSNEE